MLQPREADAPKASKNSRFSGPLDPEPGGLGYWLLAIGYSRCALRVSRRGSAG
jgi:hypothetical protein